MKSLVKRFRGFMGNEEGQGLVEYALIIALVAIVVIISLTLLGRRVSNSYTNIAGALGGPGGGGW
jgi:pilus assembly protein Flp/PilA